MAPASGPVGTGVLRQKSDVAGNADASFNLGEPRGNAGLFSTGRFQFARTRERKKPVEPCGRHRLKVGIPNEEEEKPR